MGQRSYIKKSIWTVDVPGNVKMLKEYLWSFSEMHQYSAKSVMNQHLSMRLGVSIFYKTCSVLSFGVGIKSVNIKEPQETLSIKTL